MAQFALSSLIRWGLLPAAVALAFANAACSSDSGNATDGATSSGSGSGASSSSGGNAASGGSGSGGADSGGAAGSGGGDVDTAPTKTSVAAATTTATTNVNCVGGQGGKDVRPFYWEIGDEHGRLASGSVDATSGNTRSYKADTVMGIASASKWFYSTYWIQRIGGGANLSAADIQFFNFWSGYTNFSSCVGSATVGSCLDVAHDGTTNGTQDPTTINFFDYGGGHMQKHAASIAMIGGLDNDGLAKEIQSQVGTDIGITYNEPQPAGGGSTSATEYAKLLQRILSGQMKMKDVLGTHAVCVDPTTCPAAKSTPSPPGEEWHYSIGHWVEDDPKNGDGSFSSPGAFGFYPWIDHEKAYYGVLARDALGGALTSVYCGRLIRKAWLTGVPQ